MGRPSLSDKERKLRKSERRHKYYIEHKKVELASSKKYREEHRDKFNVYGKIWRERHREKWLEDHKNYQKKYLKKNNMVVSAHNKVHNAILTGQIVKKPCEKCGEEPAEAHHDDYNKPLKVRWLCKRHHAEWHRDNKPIKKGEIICVQK